MKSSNKTSLTPTASDVPLWSGEVLMQSEAMPGKPDPSPAPQPQAFLEETELGVISKRAQGCRTVAQVSIRGKRVILPRRAKRACAGQR